MKRKKPLLAILLSMLAFNLSAHDFEVDGIYYKYNNGSSGASVSVTFKGNADYDYSNEYSGEVIIPESVAYNGKTYSVTSIGVRAFYNCSSLTSITIPNSVTSIGGAAFSDCTGLTSITIPNSVTSIGESVFRYCSNLYSISIGNGVTSIPDFSLGTETQIKSLTIGTGVLKISKDAFRHNPGESYYKPTKVIWLTNTPPSGYVAADGINNYVANDLYTSLTNVIIYPHLSSLFVEGGIKYVPVSPSERTCDAIDCVYDNTAKSISIGNTVKYKGVTMSVLNVIQHVCCNNPYIKNVVFDFYGAVPWEAFHYCKRLNQLTLSNNVWEIGGGAFRGCFALKELVIPNSVLFIEKKAFQNCKNLSAITIPESVWYLEDYAFDGCSSLKDFIIADREDALIIGSNGSDPFFASCPLISVYIGGIIMYNTSSGKGYSPFYRNTTLQTVTITDKETEIYDNEFYGCTNLKNVKIGDGVTKIGNWAFSGCASLDYFAFGSSVEEIGQEAFSDCVSVTKLISRAQNPPSCGTQALDDINKWECTLIVPEGRVDAYRHADQWKEFFFVEEGNGIATGIEDNMDNNQYPITNNRDTTTNNHEEVYDLQGRKQDKMQQGLSIIRMSDGTIKKVAIK